jgi:predicted RNA-binding protein with PUA-like domain
MVHIKLMKKFKNPVGLDEIKATHKLTELKLVQKGNRLSITPVTSEVFEEILKIGNLE